MKNILTIAGKILLCLLPVAFIGYLMYFSLLPGYEYQARLIMEKNNCLVDFEKIDNGCLLITKTDCAWNFEGPYLYCGKYFLENSK